MSLLRSRASLQFVGSCWCAVALMAFPLASKADDWPQFRGSQSLGTGESDRLPVRWSETENVRWKQPIAGRGWSSPITWGDRIYLTTVVNLGKSEPAQRGLYFGGERPKPPESVHQWRVLCLDLNTGKTLWDELAYEGQPQSSLHIKNTFASETPATDGKRLYAYFGNHGIYCYDLDGKPLWSKRFEPKKTRGDWGTASSPIVFQDRVFIVNDNEEASYIVALDAKNGEELWRQSRDEASNWATPFIWHSGQRTELVTSGNKRIRSYDLDGNLIWELGGMSSVAIPTPFAANGMLYLASGYVMDKNRPILAVKPGASGDISPKPGETTGEYIAWSQGQAGPYNPTPVLYKDYLYVLLDRGILACYNALTGKEEYGKTRIPDGKAFTTSPWAYRDKIFCLNEFGKTFVIQPGPEFKVLYTNDLPEDTMCMATPAIVGGKLLIRTGTDLYCFEEGASADPQAAAAK